MADFSQYTGTCYVATDPEFIETETYKLFSARVCQRNYKDESQFLTLKAWGRLAERMEKCVKKGSKLLANGELQIRSFIDKNDQERIGIDWVADKFEFLPNQAKNTNKETAAVTTNSEVVTDDVPF